MLCHPLENAFADASALAELCCRRRPVHKIHMMVSSSFIEQRIAHDIEVDPAMHRMMGELPSAFVPVRHAHRQAG